MAANHSFFQATGGTWAPNNSAIDFDALLPAEHAVLITIDGLRTTGFTGVHNVTYEIDHYASSFGLADRTFTGTIDFGGLDVGLDIDLRSHNQIHNVHNFTVATVPEPSTYALMGLFLIGFALVRRKSRGAE